MKKLIITTAMVIGLAACSGGGSAKDRYVQACLADGETPEAECVCEAEAAIEALDPKLVSKLIEAREGGENSDAALAEIIGDMEPDEMTQFMTFAMQVGSTCMAQ